MTESESVALPLGDAPIFSPLHIIADLAGFVNRFCKKVLQNFLPWLFMLIAYPVFGGFMSPFREKILKKFRKSVEKTGRMCYNKQALISARGTAG